ncbi:hypothetical protein GF322_00105 [Candidatus Dependentiae bacterium]|nr:hypothetical protein [Candidatus Dependentiae bacterium]
MWCNFLENNFFIKELYKKIPELNNVRISEINVHDEGHRISIVFELPYYPDNPPQKWVNAKYNTAYVQIDFDALHRLYIEYANLCSLVGYINANSG